MEKTTVAIDGSFVGKIADMQRDLDAYNVAFGNLIGYLKGRFGDTCKPVILKGMAATEEAEIKISMVCEAAFLLRERYDKLVEKYGDKGV